MYAGNNPVSFVDPWGLYRLEFDDYGRVYAVIDLNAGDTLYNIAQAEVGDGNSWVNMGYQYDPGYLFDGEWVDITGIYNDAYPNPNPNKPYIGPEDYAAGVRLVYINSNFYYDVSIPMNNATWRAGQEAAEHTFDTDWFISKVDHGRAWDIKLQENWEETLGISYPGSATSEIAFYGEIFTPEQLGNVLYGYAGMSAGFPRPALIAGSIWAAGTIDMNEFRDWKYIERGISWYMENAW